MCREGGNFGRVNGVGGGVCHEGVYFWSNE